MIFVQGIFQPHIQHLLCLATPVDIVLLGVSFSKFHDGQCVELFSIQVMNVMESIGRCVWMKSCALCILSYVNLCICCITIFFLTLSHGRHFSVTT